MAGRLVLLTPIEPAATGNGLAMRTELFRRSAAADFEVRTIVVPVAGRVAAGPPTPDDSVVVVPADAAAARRGAISLAADPAWAERLALAEPLPTPARVASPGLVDEVVRAAGPDPAVAVALHVVRAYMAPLGAAVRERLGTRWATLDLDEDDASFARSLGDHEAASGYDRLLGVFGSLFDRLSAASATEAARIGQRHGLAVDRLPNAVQVPAAPRRAAGESGALLFVGNLTYPPNVEAAALLADSILPALRRRLDRPVRATLVGPHDGSLERLRRADVEVTGFVRDLEPYYASAAVAVVPLQAGAGTRIKLLEAFAHGVPVVASRAAAEGLEVVDGRHLLLADDPESAARAIEALLTREGLADALAAESARLVRERYSYEAVVPMIRAFYGRAAAAAEERS